MAARPPPPDHGVPAPAVALPDSVTDHPLLRFAPAWAAPFVQLARLDRPAGWWLLLLPCWQSNALASAAAGVGPHYLQLALFFIGAIAMRGAGSTYNDIVDRAIDAQVARTRLRPLPSGRASVAAAKMFLVVQCLAGLAVLLSFNRFTIVLGLSSLTLVAIYPFMKRVTSWPQATLGLAFAWGALMGWAAVFGALAAPAVLLYAGAAVWTIGYDTIYAVQDVRDDSAIGVRSTARLFGEDVRRAVGVFYAAAALLIGAAIALAHAHPLAWVGYAGFVGHLAWQTTSVRPHDTPRALALFRSNRDAGLLLFAGFFAAALAA